MLLCLNSVILFLLHKGNIKEWKIGVPDFGAAFVSIDASVIYVVVISYLRYLTFPLILGMVIYANKVEKKEELN